MSEVNRIVIVGGGTAGWLTAGLLAATHSGADNNGQRLSVTVIESDAVPPIWVGEGTWPTMRRTLATIGISEAELVTQASATFKQASKFVNWYSDNGRNQDNSYYHPFSAPQGSATLDITPYWLTTAQTHSHYAQDVCFQPALCDAGLAPKLTAHGKQSFTANYGYHLDAGQFISLLRRHCVNRLGVTHLVDKVTQVNTQADSPEAGIVSLQTQQSGKIEGDLFVDCSGFSGLLINKALGVKLKDASHHLFANSALVCQAPFENETAPIPCHTLSTAQEAGWIWDIGLQHRRGTGYVFSREHQDVDRAADTLSRYLSQVAPSMATPDAFREIQFKTGYRETFWHNNCVAIGLSSGFLEPLEASSLMLIEQSAMLLAEQLPANTTIMSKVSQRFNSRLTYLWERTIEFLKLHYVLSNRPEAFWQDNKQRGSIPERLADLLEEWRYRPILDSDFPQANEAFSAQSYRYILYGMGPKTDFNWDMSTTERSLKHHNFATKQGQLNQTLIGQLKERLPSHRGLVESFFQS